MRKTLWILLLCLSVSSCRLYDRLFKGDAVARVGKDVLYRSDIEKLNIKGFSPEDSVRMVERYIQSWAKDRLLLDMAESRLSKADRDVTVQLEEYRDFYDANPSSFTTHIPLIRGVYIKVSDNSPNLNPIKSLYRSRVQEDLDRLDQLCYSSAERYYFLDEWTGLDAIVEGTGLDVAAMARILEGRSGLERSHLGYTYLIEVDDYVPAGAQAPYEYCRDRIRDVILSRRKQELLTSLERNLLNDAIGSEKLKIYKE